MSIVPMYSPTGFASVTIFPARAAALTPAPMSGSLDRLTPPNSPQQIRRRESVDAGCGDTPGKTTVASAARLISAPSVFAGCVRCIAPCVVFHLLYGLYESL